MRSRPLASMARALSCVVFLVFPVATFAASTESVLHNFTGGVSDGAWPKAGVVIGPDGALYGATQYGGAFQFGTIYKVTHNSDGTWSESVIYSFTNVNDGAGPIGPIAFDVTGNIFGTTTFGINGKGSVFELAHHSDGTWTPQLLYTFTGGTDGQQPVTGVTIDKSGNVFGTVSQSSNGGGVVYELSPNGDGTWAFQIVHTFTGFSDGWAPSTTPIMDNAGNLYGATAVGGTGNSGTVYELSPSGSGWTENVLYSFSGGKDGANPDSLLIDKFGNFYGTAGAGGKVKATPCSRGCGTVFHLAHSGTGALTFNVVYTFDWTTGATPNSLASDKIGNLFGTTLQGGASSAGVSYELKLTSGGRSRTFNLLYTFGQMPDGSDGISPLSTIVSQGRVFGTTLNSTCYLCGTVFEITP